MTKKSKLLINSSMDPVTSRLREAVYAKETSNSSTEPKINENQSKDDNNNQILNSNIDKNTSQVDGTLEENRRKKRRKSTPQISIKNLNNYIESDNDDEYLNFCTDDYDEIENEFENDEFNEDDYFYEDEQRKWNLDEKLNILNKYNSNFVKFLDAKEFDFKYIQENGFNFPLVFIDKFGLCLRVPSENFRVSDVKSCVGSKRIVDVVDCNTQKGLSMSMKDWCEYYENPKRDRLLNVISLEFSHTKLENYVEEPLVVRQLDWIETAWPRHLREAHTESTNIIEKMKYPKVQKYVLMSVAGCYTDFHIDMGGTSVWYHILKGEKIFWLIPPTDKNLKTYEKWVLSGNQSKVFLPDLVDDCQRIVLKQGSTFMLPSGWIHGVYTSKDSLVFGGNFLHSFNIPMQLKIYNIETKTKVPQQYRYPFFIEMIWFVLERYVHCLTGITHMDDLTECSKEDDKRKAYKTFQPNSNLILNKVEFEGLKELYDFIINLNENKRHIPKEIVQPDLLIQSFKKLLDDYGEKFGSNESSEPANGLPFMHWPKPEKKYMKKIENSIKQKKDQLDQSYNNEQLSLEQSPSMTADTSQDPNDSIQVSSILQSQINNQSFTDLSPNQIQTQTRKHVMRNLPRTKGSIKKRLRPQNIPRSNVERRRRVRCHDCEPCTRDDCGECKYCKDMKKFGGTGISKQCCLAKQCLQPLLPTTTTCMLCEMLIDRFQRDKTNIMFECEICFEIYHEECFRKQYIHLNHIEPIINEDLSNCWKCPNCVNKGYIKADNLKQESKQAIQFDQNSASSSLNNSFNSVITNVLNTSITKSINNNIDFILTPSPTVTSNSTSFNNSINEMVNIKPKQKRHRRTKQEIENSKLKIEVNNDYFLNSDSIQTNLLYDTNNNLINPENDHNSSTKRKRKSKLNIKVDSFSSNQTQNHDNDDSIITVESLTYLEKQILLREFCEICYDNETNETITNPIDNTINNHSNPILLKSNSVRNSIKNTNKKQKVTNSNSNDSDHETIIADDDDDKLEFYNDEGKINSNNNDSSSFRSASVNNNESTSTQNSFTETIQTDEYNVDYDFDPSNEHIYDEDE